EQTALALHLDDEWMSGVVDGLEPDPSSDDRIREMMRIIRSEDRRVFSVRQDRRIGDQAIGRRRGQRRSDPQRLENCAKGLLVPRILVHFHVLRVGADVIRRYSRHWPNVMLLGF